MIALLKRSMYRRERVDGVDGVDSDGLAFSCFDATKERSELPSLKLKTSAEMW